MPVTPAVLKKIRQDRVDAFLSKLDEKIRAYDPIVWYKDRVDIIMSDELSKDEYEVISDLYIKVGWKEVKIRTSAENGERPGLVNIKLFYPDGYHKHV